MSKKRNKEKTIEEKEKEIQELAKATRAGDETARATLLKEYGIAVACDNALIKVAQRLALKKGK